MTGPSENPRQCPDAPLGARDAGDLDEWLAIAQPGEDFCFFSGFGPPVALVKYVHAQVEAGAVEPVQRRRRDGRGFDYLIQRRALLAPMAANGGGAPARREEPPGDDAEALLDRVMRMLRRAALDDKVCPTNGEIARTLGLHDAAGAAYQIRKLRALGRIAVQHVKSGPNAGARVVTILKSGKATRGVS